MGGMLRDLRSKAGLLGVVALEQVLMLNDARMRVAQVTEFVRSNGWRSLFKEVLFFRRTAIVVEKDLSELTERSKPLASAKLKLVEIDKDMLSSGIYRFAVNSRYLRALNYLKHGCAGYALGRAQVGHAGPGPYGLALRDPHL